MKVAILVAAMVMLNSCNTSIGLWRDTQQAYSWTKQKIQESNGGGGGDTSGAPVY